MSIQFDEEKQNKKLDELRKQEEEDLVSILAASKYNIPYINLAGTIVENEALRVIPEKDAREYAVAPFKIVNKKIDIAIKSPDSDNTRLLKEMLEQRGYTPIFHMASQASLEKVWERYKELSFATTSRAGSLDISSEVVAELGAKLKSLSDIKKAAEDTATENKVHRISKLLEIIVSGGISIAASDIHIEPEEKSIRVRFRLDGLLHDVFELDHPTYKLLNSRLKLIAGLKLTSENKAQDGRFSIFLDDTEINMRVSLIPGAYGESYVMRILNPKSIQVKLEDMGIEPRLFEIIQKEISKPHGLILLTGPTGSGKTTTLYAFLSKIYSPEVKIITIEDPVEYHLKGITQTQTDNKKGYTFLEGLRSALRQDPDVIMVGEIRDAETAKIAVESALTGHLVFSTLHTNTAAGVIPRLTDLEVNPKILPSALSLSIAQRLVRKLCEDCKKEKQVTDDEKKQILQILMDAKAQGKDLAFYGISENQDIHLWEPVGCTVCNGTGYKGRMGIFEAIISDESIEKLATTNPSEREIKRVASHQGILDMKQDGVIKALKSITSLEEVKSVVDLDEE